MKFEFSYTIDGSIEASTLEGAKQALDNQINLATLRNAGINVKGDRSSLNEPYEGNAAGVRSESSESTREVLLED